MTTLATGGNTGAAPPVLDLSGLNDEALTQLIKGDLFDDSKPGVHQWLMGPGAGRQLNLLRVVASTLNGQLQLYAETGPDAQFDEGWRHRAGVLFVRVNKRIAEVKPLVAEQNRLHNETQRADRAKALQLYVGELRHAIYLHRQASGNAGLDPEPHDLTLWAILDEPQPEDLPEPGNAA